MKGSPPWRLWDEIRKSGAHVSDSEGATVHIDGRTFGQAFSPTVVIADRIIQPFLAEVRSRKTFSPEWTAWPSIAPPFDHTFIEWKDSDGRSLNEQVGVMAETWKSPNQPLDTPLRLLLDGKGPRSLQLTEVQKQESFIVKFHVFEKWRIAEAGYPAGSMLMRVAEAVMVADRLGRPYDNFIPIIDPKPPYVDMSDERYKEAKLYTLIESVALAAHMISLMHCKNIEIVDAPAEGTRQQQRHAERKRKGLPKLDYKVVNLKPQGGKRKSGTGVMSVDTEQPWHLVRGHFKTYTEDAPLLGQHVGTWWWGAQVRGNPQEGIVVKDYDLDPLLELND